MLLFRASLPEPGRLDPPRAPKASSSVGPVLVVDLMLSLIGLSLLLVPDLAYGQDPPPATAETASEEAAPASAPAVPPVVVVPMVEGRVTEESVAAIRDALVATLQPMVIRRQVLPLQSEERLRAFAECEEAICLGGQVAELGAIQGVLLRLSSRSPRRPIELTLEVIDPVSGSPRMEPITGEISPDQAADPSAAVAALAAPLRQVLPEAPPRTTLLITANVADAQVLLNDQPIGATPLGPLELEAGQYTVQMSRQGFLVQRRPVDVARGATARIDLRLQPDEATQARDDAGEPLYAPGEAATAGSTEETALTDEWWFWAAVGGGAAVILITGIVIGVAASGGDEPQQMLEIIPVPPYQ